MDNAFRYVASSDGLAAESSYPYRDTDGSCSSGRAAVAIRDFEDVSPNDEAALIQAVSRQPLSVVINGGDFVFWFYGGGVLGLSECGTDLDHAISWGEDGYVRIRRGVRGEDVCGLTKLPSYPV